MNNNRYKSIGWVSIVFSILSSILLFSWMIILTIKSGRFSDDLYYLLSVLIISFLVLFLTGRFYLKVSNEKAKDTKLVATSSIFSLIGILLSTIITVWSLQFSGGPEGALGIMLVLPVVFGFFYLISIVLLLISWIKNK